MSKKNKYSHLSEPQGILDFHGRGILSSQDVYITLASFLADAEKKQWKRLLIITGKGLHSQEKNAVIRPLVKEFLQQFENIKTVTPARRDRGGDGAFEVTLL